MFWYLFNTIVARLVISHFVFILFLSCLTAFFFSLILAALGLHCLLSIWKERAVVLFLLKISNEHCQLFYLFLYISWLSCSICRRPEFCLTRLISHSPIFPSLHTENAWSGNVEWTNCSSLLSSHITYPCVPTDLEIFIMNSSQPLFLFLWNQPLCLHESKPEWKVNAILGHAQKLIPKAMQGEVCTT